MFVVGKETYKRDSAAAATATATATATKTSKHCTVCLWHFTIIYTNSTHKLTSLGNWLALNSKAKVKVRDRKIGKLRVAWEREFKTRERERELASK